MPADATREQATGELPDDIGRRISDAMHLQILAGNVGKWIAPRLRDGSSDGIAYDTRADAVNHQVHEQLCCYLKITPDGISPGDAYTFVRVNRALYDQGLRLADPDMPGEPIYPNTVEETEAFLRRVERRA